MEPVAIFRRLYSAGVRLELQDDRLAASPAARLTDELRALIRNHKPELVDYLTKSQQTTAQLIESAMRASDHHRDEPEARQQMRRECLDTPPHLRADLTDHFLKNYRPSP